MHGNVPSMIANRPGFFEISLKTMTNKTETGEGNAGAGATANDATVTCSVKQQLKFNEMKVDATDIMSSMEKKKIIFKHVYRLLDKR